MLHFTLSFLRNCPYFSKQSELDPKVLQHILQQLSYTYRLKKKNQFFYPASKVGATPLNKFPYCIKLIYYYVIIILLCLYSLPQLGTKISKIDVISLLKMYCTCTCKKCIRYKTNYILQIIVQNKTFFFNNIIYYLFNFFL